MNQDTDNSNQNNSNEQNDNNFSHTNSIIKTSDTNVNNNLENTNNIKNEENNSNSINDIKQDNSKSKNKSVFKKICIIISIVVAIAGNSIGIIFVIAAFTMKSAEFFGPIINFFSFVIAFAIFIHTWAIIAIIWIIYGIIKLIRLIYTKISKKNKKIYIIILIIIALLLLIVPFLVKLYNYKNKNLMDVLTEIPEEKIYDNSTNYFIYKDKIYYYNQDHNYSYNNAKFYDRLFVMNLDGTNNKKLAETDELGSATFYFVYNDEAYYYTPYYRDNKKINLKTGEITSLGTDDIYITKTLKNGIVYSFSNNIVDGEEKYSTFKKIDLKNNKVISKVKTKYMTSDEYFFDYDGCNVFYFENDNSQYPSIYKNNEIIFEFPDYYKYDFSEIEFLAVNNDYIYFKLNKIIYKLNIKDKFIEKTITNHLKDIKRISSGTNTDNYFYSDNKIYTFNMDTDTFELLIRGIENQPEDVFNINNKLIFTLNIDSGDHSSNVNYHNLGQVIIYNKLNNKTEKFDKIHKVFFEENNMYLLYRTNYNYSVNKIKL